MTEENYEEQQAKGLVKILFDMENREFKPHRSPLIFLDSSDWKYEEPSPEELARRRQEELIEQKNKLRLYKLAEELGLEYELKFDRYGNDRDDYYD